MKQQSLRGKLIIIVAPSGTGKSTLIENLCKKIPNLKWSVSCTTRKMREGEIDGQHYTFVTKEFFESKISQGAFVEWAKVHSNYYGTLKSFIDEGLENGDLLLFDLDVQGCDQMKKIYGEEAKVIFIKPPSVEELEKRLIKRGTESREVINERIQNARNEILRADDFDYKIINDDFLNADKELEKIVTEIIKGK